MVDGWGRGFCSELVFDENGTVVDEISELDSVLGAFMDLDTVYTFRDSSALTTLICR